MISLKPTFIMTVIVVKTFLVLTIIEHVFSESEVEKCTRYIKQLYNYENDPVEMFKKGFSWFNKAEINILNSNFASKTDPEGPSMTIVEMNKYTEGYFNELLKCVEIREKESLDDPGNFCGNKFQGKIVAAQQCFKVIQRKFRLTGEEFGCEIFDLLYKEWTINDVQLILDFNEEHAQMNIQLDEGEEYDTNEAEKEWSQFKFLLDVFHISITSYYKHFQDKLVDISDVSQMPTPEEYCERIISGSSSS